MNSKNIYINTIETLILDEADKLLEMGFTDHVNQVVKLIKQASMVENRQTILLSATLSKGIKDLASLALKEPVEVKVEKQQNSIDDRLKLTHYFVRLPETDNIVDRDAYILSLCLKHFKERTIVFFNEKRVCHRMMIIFRFFGLSATEIHGDMNQRQRMESVESFQRGECNFLMATDLLSRGFDIH